MMLTRRIFRQLTSSILHDSPLPLRLSSQCCHRLPSSSHPPHSHPHTRHASSSSSSTRWKSRQSRDVFSRAAKVSGLASRAAFKLLQIDQRYRLFKPGQTVVDLGFAPGSWSQVAVSKVCPDLHGDEVEEGDTGGRGGGRKMGRVIGIDILPVQPPRGVSTIQGNFLSEAVREEVRKYVAEEGMGRVKSRRPAPASAPDEYEEDDGVVEERHKDLDLRPEPSISTTNSNENEEVTTTKDAAKTKRKTNKNTEEGRTGTIDVLLSDMCAPWPQTTSLHSQSITRAYVSSLRLSTQHKPRPSHPSIPTSPSSKPEADAQGNRMSNTSGSSTRDHFASMDLCASALTFAYDTLRPGGSFVCKFFDGSEARDFEARLKLLFERVVREKPEGSRGESREAYFVCLRRRRGTVRREEVLGEGKS